MAKKKINKKAKKKPYVYVPQREIKLAIEGPTGKKKKLTDTEIFWSLKGKTEVKNLAKKLGKSERTVRSYYKYLSGQSMGKYDRKPPPDVLKKLKPIAKKINKKLPVKEKIKLTKVTKLTVTQTRKIKQDEFISRDQKKLLKNKLQELGKDYSFTLIRLGIRYYKKHGETFDKFQTISSQYRTHPQIMEQVQDYLNSLLYAYIVKAEIFYINFEVVGRIKGKK